MIGKAPYLIFLLCTAVHSTATAAAEALLPFYTKFLGASIALAGLPFVVNSVSRIFTDPVAGAISDRVGARFFLILAMLIGAFASLLAGTIAKLTPFLFFWVFVGISESMFTLSIRKLAFEHAPQGNESSAVGKVTTLYGIGNVLGPPIGGYLGSWLGTRVLFLIYALPLLVAALLSWRFPLRSAGKNGPPTGGRSALRTGLGLFSQPLFVAGCLAMFYMFFSRWGATKVAVPLFLAEKRMFSLADVGTVFGINGCADILGRYLGGILGDRWGVKIALQTALAISGMAFVAFIQGQGFLGVALLIAGIGFGHGCLNVTTSTLAMEVAGPGRGGLALGLARCFGSVGSVAGPFLIGTIAARADYGSAFTLVGGFALVIAIGLSFVRGQSRSSTKNLQRDDDGSAET